MTLPGKSEFMPVIRRPGIIVPALPVPPHGRRQFREAGRLRDSVVLFRVFPAASARIKLRLQGYTAEKNEDTEDEHGDDPLAVWLRLFPALPYLRPGFGSHAFIFHTSITSFAPVSVFFLQSFKSPLSVIFIFLPEQDETSRHLVRPYQHQNDKRQHDELKGIEPVQGFAVHQPIPGRRKHDKHDKKYSNHSSDIDPNL
jgi:hypothetical protein